MRQSNPQSQENAEFLAALRQVAIARGGQFVGDGEAIHAALSAISTASKLTTCGLHAAHLAARAAGSEQGNPSVNIETLAGGKCWVVKAPMPAAPVMPPPAPAAPAAPVVAATHVGDPQWECPIAHRPDQARPGMLHYKMLQPVFDRGSMRVQYRDLDSGAVYRLTPDLELVQISPAVRAVKSRALPA